MLQRYIRENPEAVFIQRTHASTVLDAEGVWRAGYETAEHVFEDIPSDTRVLIKPNLTAGHLIAQSPRYLIRELGVCTDVNFVGGVVDRLQELNARDIAIVEKNARVFSERGYEAMMSPRHVTLACLDKGHYDDSDLTVIPIQGVWSCARWQWFDPWRKRVRCL